MPTHPKRLTDSEARRIAPPPAPDRPSDWKGRLPSAYTITWCPNTPGFGVRVMHTGARSWIAEQRVEGRTVRRTLGPVVGRGAISADAARKKQVDIASELQNGIDRLEVQRERVAAAKAEGVTFGEALREYVKTKRRAKDGLPLKERTKADYLAMLSPSRAGKGDGRPTLAGELHDIAGTPLVNLTAAGIKNLHASLAPRGERRQTYAMQVLRAVLRHHGITIAANPLASTTAGKDRVHLAPSRGNPSPIPPERVGAWWRAALAVDTVSSDSLRFMLLTGCRPGEVASLRVGNVDTAGARVKLLDTKNRKDHTVVLSTQALGALTPHLKGKAQDDLVFGVADAGKTLAKINAAANTPGISQKKLRHTFASIAEELVSAGAVKRMMNHTPAGDVTLGHYVGKSESQMRAAWQQVADFIEQAK